jgi:hypothetical protein
MPLIQQTLTAPPEPAAARTGTLPRGEAVHRAMLALLICGITSLLIFLIANGHTYYSLSVEERPFSPLHQQLRSSGAIGLRLGILSLCMFGILFLYPLRKRWRWLSSIGATRRWLNFHVFFGISTPLVVTFHTSFKWHGVAGLAYWTMIAVAASGFIGRYLYAKIPRSRNSVELTMAELESQMALIAASLHDQEIVRAEELEPLLRVPTIPEIRRMSLMRALWMMLALDFARPFRISRLRRRLQAPAERISTLGGLLASRSAGVEAILSLAARQSRLLAGAAFLDRTARVFYLWHVVHRPFSISFVALIAVHIGVALSVGLR